MNMSILFFKLKLIPLIGALNAYLLDVKREKQLRHLNFYFNILSAVAQRMSAYI